MTDVDGRFGDVLRDHRIRRGVTQQQLADLSTLSVRTIRNLESGRASQPHEHTMQLIADGLMLTKSERAAMRAVIGRTAIVELESLDDVGTWAPPGPFDSLVARQAEFALLRELCSSRDQRLVTVTGLSGMGKTRLALSVAADLHATTGMRVVWSAPPAARGPGVHRSPLERRGIEEQVTAMLLGSPSAVDDLARLVGTADVLLVLDGHRLTPVGVRGIVDLLGRCRGLRVLGTAWVRTGVAGERVLPLAPLAVSEPGRAMGQAGLDPAVAYLTHFVHQACPGFAATFQDVAAMEELCRLLDGIPVALTTAASWFAVYEPRAVLHYVTVEPFGILSDALDRMRASIEFALEDLSQKDGDLLNELAGLPADWTVGDAAAQLGLHSAACGRAVRKLLELGLIRPTGAARFRVLNLLRAVTAAPLGLPAGAAV